MGPSSSSIVPRLIVTTGFGSFVFGNGSASSPWRFQVPSFRRVSCRRRLHATTTSRVANLPQSSERKSDRTWTQGMRRVGTGRPSIVCVTVVCFSSTSPTIGLSMTRSTWTNDVGR